jgi:hypothetical protein
MSQVAYILCDPLVTMATNCNKTERRNRIIVNYKEMIEEREIG